METDSQTLITIAIISAGLGTLVSGLWQIVHKLIDNSRDKRIAKQLYAKYNLTYEQIDYVEKA